MDWNENCGSKAVIIGMSEKGEKICAASGRMSTQAGNSLEILEKSLDTIKNSNLIKKVTKSGHNSIVEHAFFNIAFCNVSAVVEQFMIEFRLASFTVKSRRYVDFSNAGHYTPEFENEKDAEKFKAHVDFLFGEYEFFLNNGIPKEDARFVLPYCYRSNFYCSLNARELLNVLRAMIYGRGRAFTEIYNLGRQLLSQVKELAPGIFSDFENTHSIENDDLDLRDIVNSNSSSSPTSTGSELSELLSFTPNAEKCVAETALITYSQLCTSDIESIIKSKKNVEEIISRVMDCSRPRALESICYTFRLNGISLAGVTHVVRHRMQGVMVPPLTSVDRSKFIIPKTISDNAEFEKRYKTVFSENCKVYSELKADGVSEEALVYLDLSGNTLDIVSIMNARELLLFLKLRTCERAQWEIRKYAVDMLKKLRSTAPDIFNFFGPSCYASGKCPEGRLSCGRTEEIQKRFTPKK